MMKMMKFNFSLSDARQRFKWRHSTDNELIHQKHLNTDMAVMKIPNKKRKKLKITFLKELLQDY